MWVPSGSLQANDLSQPRREQAKNAGARLHTSLRTYDDQASTSAPSFDLEVLRLQGKWSNERGYQLRTEVNLAAEYDRKQCERYISNEIKRQRCKSQLFRDLYFSAQISSEAQIEFGQFELPQFGWEGYSEPVTNILPILPYDGPFDSIQTGTRVIWIPEGQWTLVVTNDVTTKYPSRGEFTDNQTQPTWLVEWQEMKCSTCALVQMGNYDLNHSQFLNLGWNYNGRRLRGYIDFRLDARDRKYHMKRRRSLRWSSTVNSEWALTATQQIVLKIDGFRMDHLGEVGAEHIANLPEEVDHNLIRAALAHVWAQQSFGPRYYADVRHEIHRDYLQVPEQKFFIQRRTIIGVGVMHKL